MIMNRMKREAFAYDSLILVGICSERSAERFQGREILWIRRVKKRDEACKHSVYRMVLLVKEASTRITDRRLLPRS